MQMKYDAERVHEFFRVPVESFLVVPGPVEADGRGPSLRLSLRSLFLHTVPFSQITLPLSQRMSLDCNNFI